MIKKEGEDPSSMRHVCEQIRVALVGGEEDV